jgi:hypothetical protein
VLLKSASWKTGIFKIEFAVRPGGSPAVNFREKYRALHGSRLRWDTFKGKIDVSVGAVPDPVFVTVPISNDVLSPVARTLYAIPALFS